MITRRFGCRFERQKIAGKNKLYGSGWPQSDEETHTTNQKTVLVMGGDFVKRCNHGGTISHPLGVANKATKK
jgi:hypothetical protein